ncbi:MAG: membrane integrity-associated transporter subunit PqiC [Proteobacteria bacterium]|nr:membrane integrity-associated transporter subunit PqiC [Pseudomonadota bacterium]
MKCVSLCALWLLAAAGCMGIGGTPATPTSWLDLEPALPDAGLAPGGPSLYVAPFGSEPPFQTERLVTREAPGRYAFANYHRWTAPPGALIARHVAEALSRGGFFGAVATAPGALMPDYRLGGSVRALYWDRAAREAVLEVEVSLVDAAGRLRSFRVYRARQPTTEEGVEGFLRAAARALEEVLRETLADISLAIEPPHPRSTTGGDQEANGSSGPPRRKADAEGSPPGTVSP